MHRANPAAWQHSHDFTADSSVAESRTRLVIVITAVMMLVEIAAGVTFNSMALLADGWHMSTHVAAFLITALAYHFSRKHARDARYSFGTGKMGVLGGFASAIVLAMVALLMAGESVHRLFTPAPIHFDQAILVAVIGLVVNLVCALIFKDAHHHHHHHHGHEHPHDHDHHHSHGGTQEHHDLNLRAAYLHVLADAMTSVTAIVALLAGKFYGWSWLDPVMGLVGSLIVGLWAYGLVRDTSGILLDRTPETSDLPEVMRRDVEADGDSLVTDLHIWQIGAGKFAAIVAIVAHQPKPVEDYRALFRAHEELVHVTVEVQACHEHETPAPLTAVHAHGAS
ncbi:MAG TPA: CDF family Co(II)/Ni(II) efflux transporter DmeF [Verrucomicrobiae bacterium]|nr:CDF family Co(II)/Ni(II) efflux transporter DmeF [Verrucomicrobiae bacterium]